MTRIDDFIVKELAFDLGSPDEGTRRHALVSLSYLPAGEKVENLMRLVATEDDSEELRYLAKRFLDEIEKRRSGQQPSMAAQPAGKDSLARDDVAGAARKESREAVKGDKDSGEPTRPDEPPDKEDLLGAIRGDDRKRALKAVSALTMMREDGLALTLELIEETRDPWLLASLVNNLKAFGRACHVRHVQKFLKHKDNRVRANAVEVLQKIGGELTIPLLKPMLQDSDNRVRANAVNALYDHDPDNTFQVLEQMSLSPKEWMRDSALYCLGLIKHERVETILLEMFEKETSRKLMKREAELLARVGTGLSLGWLGWLLEQSGRDKVILMTFVANEVRERLGLDNLAERALIDEYREKRKREEARKRQLRLAKRKETGKFAGLPTSGKTTYVLNAESVMAAALTLILFLGVIWGLFIKEPRRAVTNIYSYGEPPRPPDYGRKVEIDKGIPGERIHIRGRVRYIDRKGRILLLRHYDYLILFRSAAVPWEKIRMGRLVEVECLITGRRQYGSLCVQGLSLKVIQA